MFNLSKLWGSLQTCPLSSCQIRGGKRTGANVECYDVDEVVRVSIGDRDVRKLLEETYGIGDAIKVQELEKNKRNEILLACLSLGAGLRQLSRLTGVPYGVIHRLNKNK